MDLGGKAPEIQGHRGHSIRLNPCFGGFGWERHRGHSIRGGRRGVLILVLVDLGGKGFRWEVVGAYYEDSLNPCFGGFGWERCIADSLLGGYFCLNPCFGGFGWESRPEKGLSGAQFRVLILVLVDLGGKVLKTSE